MDGRITVNIDRIREIKGARQVMILRISRFTRNDKIGNGLFSQSLAGADNHGDISRNMYNQSL